MTEIPQLSAADLVQRIERCWLTITGRMQEAALASEGRAIINTLLSIGEAHYRALDIDQLSPAARAEHLAYVFEWPEGAKRFAVLWRSTLLEWERAAIVQREGRAGEAELIALATSSQERLEAAAHHWLGDFNDYLGHLTTDAAARDRQLYKWGLQNAPWPVYREQLTDVQAQITQLHEDFGVRLSAAGTLKSLNERIQETPGTAHGYLDKLRDAVQQARELVEETGEGDAGKVSTSKLAALDPAERLPGLVQPLTEEANAIIDLLPERVRMFVGGAGGRLTYRELDLEKQAGQWLSAEVMPELQRAGRSLEQLSAELSRTLTDVRNRILLARERTQQIEDAEAGTSATTRLCAPLDRYLERLESRGQELEVMVREAAARADSELRLSRVYEPQQGFLEVSFGAGVSQVRRTQDALYSRVVSWFVDQKERFRGFRRKLAQEDQLSIGERIVRVIQSRRPDPDNGAYTSVLVTRGFIGEAFHAGRISEIERCRSAIEAAREGFRGSIVLTGQRYSGKTHMAELLAGRYFEQRTVRLRAGETFEVAGRTHKCGHDLGAAMAFVRKYSLGQRLLIVIDDLELWTDPEHSLAANAAALRDSIDELGGRLFFIVTMSNWTLARLRDSVKLAKAFQLEVNLDRMELAPFIETVLTRHAATHMRPVEEDGEELNEATLRDRAEDIWREALGNVGDGLRRWAAAVERVDTGAVQLSKPSRYQLPNFIDADMGIVLAAIKRERYVNEYQLRQTFGPACESTFRPYVQRLVRLDVLQRHRSGTLSVNPVVSNELGRLLQRDEYIQSAYSQMPLPL